ncbi:MAG TPA: DUF929 family protein [Solirubrobacteraceae bacterium]|nr:DUF929 family protein [Solirubrobacteraceae bacterium]
MSRRRALLAAVLCSALLAPSAHAAAPPVPPKDSLRQAREDLRLLPSEFAAYRKLTAATAAPLWVDPSDAVAPPYGQAVFADSRAALLGLEPALAAASPPATITAAKILILSADRRLAETMIHQAARGTGLVVRAEGMILSGDRWAATARVDFAAEQYGAAWSSAFGALTPLVTTPATDVPTIALGTAAENALATDRISLRGVHSIENQPPLTHAGQPEVLLVGPDSCAGCALESWGLVAALSQFGVFTDLHLSQSATTLRPLVRGFTFRGAGYVSPFVTFVLAAPSSHVPHPLPFVDVANKLADVGSPAAPAVAAGRTWTQLAGSLARPKTAAGQAIDGTAELLTAEICEATGGAPAAVCGAAAVSDYESQLLPAKAPPSGAADHPTTRSPAARPRCRGLRRGSPPGPASSRP